MRIGQIADRIVTTPAFPRSIILLENDPGTMCRRCAVENLGITNAKA